MSRVVAHIDLDAFFAAVEALEHPEYAGRPLVVGGSPFGRGVVSTASYEARAFGIHSAMASAEARRRCPHALFVTPNHALYARYSRRVWDLLCREVAVVEQLGLDEGYLDLTGRVGSAGEAYDLLCGLRDAIHERTRLSASFGCGTAKVVAKIASDYRKPGGVTVIPAGKEAAFLGPLPLRALPGVGPRSEERLRLAGLRSIGELAVLDDEQLTRVLTGSVGRELRDRARGIDPRQVAPGRAAISVSCEETFERDIALMDELVAVTVRMADMVAERLARSERCAQTVTVKLRYPDFTIATRSQTAPVVFADRDEIARLALIGLERALAERPPPVRLVGVGVSRLASGEQLRLPLREAAAP